VFIYEGTGAEMYLEGNVFPPAFGGNPSTVGAEIPVPVGPRVTTWAAAAIGARRLGQGSEQLAAMGEPASCSATRERSGYN